MLLNIWLNMPLVKLRVIMISLRRAVIRAELDEIVVKRYAEM